MPEIRDYCSINGNQIETRSKPDRRAFAVRRAQQDTRGFPSTEIDPHVSRCGFHQSPTIVAHGAVAEAACWSAQTRRDTIAAPIQSVLSSDVR